MNINIDLTFSLFTLLQEMLYPAEYTHLRDKEL